ncbi:MAG: YtxH domain-containing protein [Acidobacteria bacterium]|nr:MAG: YtxH domain-containing protein [Acidobacteriota bacterium]
MFNRHEEEGSNSNVAGFLLGALTGALVGAGVALLFAPKTGRRMRADLARTFERTTDQLGDLAADAVDRASDLADQAKATVKDVSARVAAATTRS